MKKILLALASAVVITSSAATAVACGFREPVNVILELMGNIAKPNSPILRAYRSIVDDYNKARPNNPIQVEVRETPANNIDNEIATGQPLPSLYVTYGDSATKYETILDQIDEKAKVVDMAQVINWSPEYVAQINGQLEPQIKFIKEKGFGDNGIKGNELTNNVPLDEITHLEKGDPDYDQNHFTPLRDSFPREGSNNDKMYVAPTAKSGMNGVMNTRLINELVKIVSGINLQENIQEAKIRDPFFFTNAGVTQWIGNRDVPLEELQGQWALPESNFYRNSKIESKKNIATLFNEWFGQMKTIAQLQAVMQDLSKLEIIILAYNLLVEYGGNKAYFKSSFSMAFDDVPGLLYTMQANLGLGDKQVYSWKSDEPYTLNLFNSGQQVEALKAVIELFAWADQLRKLDNDAGNNPDHGYGGITAKLNSGAYYSDTWQKQGMLAYFGSTAGAGFWVHQNPKDGTDTYVQVGDLQLMSAPTYQETESRNFVAQQGPGMGMFKSKNPVKNEIAIDFVNYFLRAENNTKFAIAAGYIPSNYYAYYAQKGMSGIPEEGQRGDYYQKLVEEAAKEKPEEIVSAPVLIKYVDSLLNQQTQLWTQIPTPFGDAMRFQILVPWFEANFKTIQSHNLNFDQFWKDLKNQSSIASVWRVVHGIFPVKGEFKIQPGEVEV